MTRRSLLRSALADPQLRKVAVGGLLFAICEYGTWLAIGVFAYERGGVREAGLVGFVQLGVAALAAPLLAFVVDRFPRQRVLGIGFGAQAVSHALCGAALLSDAPVVVIYGAATVVASIVTVSRPSIAAAVPSLVDTPEQLTAANVVGSLAVQSGLFLGPAGAGLLLAGSSPGSVFAAAGVLMAGATVVASRLTLRPGAGALDDESVATSSAEVVAGLSLVRSDPKTRVLLGILTLLFVLAGALDVAIVAIAFDLIGGTGATAGVLATAAGIGGTVGAIGAVALLGRRRLTGPLAIAVTLGGFAIAATALGGPLIFLALLLALHGSAAALADIAGRTMLQGMSPEDVLARVFGVLESLTMAALAVGGLVFSLLATALGIRGALVAVGLALPAILLIRLKALLEIDALRPIVDPETLRRVRAVPIFAPLPAYAAEQLLVNFAQASYPPGATLMTKGEDGRLFFLITAGSVEVDVEDGSTVQYQTGDYFGEIALLRGIPRTATVRSGPDGVEALTLDRDVFLEAVTGHPRSLARLETTITHRMIDGE